MFFAAASRRLHASNHTERLMASSKCTHQPWQTQMPRSRAHSAALIESSECSILAHPHSVLKCTPPPAARSAALLATKSLLMACSRLTIYLASAAPLIMSEPSTISHYCALICVRGTGWEPIRAIPSLFFCSALANDYLAFAG